MGGYATIVMISAYWGVVNENYLRLIKICDHVAKCLKLEDRKTFVLSFFEIIFWVSNTQSLFFHSIIEWLAKKLHYRTNIRMYFRKNFTYPNGHHHRTLIRTCQWVPVVSISFHWFSMRGHTLLVAYQLFPPSGSLVKSSKYKVLIIILETPRGD